MITNMQTVKIYDWVIFITPRSTIWPLDHTQYKPGMADITTVILQISLQLYQGYHYSYTRDTTTVILEISLQLYYRYHYSYTRDITTVILEIPLQLYQRYHQLYYTDISSVYISRPCSARANSNHRNELTRTALTQSPNSPRPSHRCWPSLIC